MKKLIAILSLGLLVLTLAVSCQQAKDKAETKTEEIMSEMDSTKATHTCPMHPEVASAEPGKCPKCGMALVEKGMKDGDMEDMPMDSTENK